MRPSPFALAALVALAAPGCARPREPTGRWTACSCDFLTDMDQPGRIRVDVCVARTVPEALAESCATHRGVGRVQDCRCGPPGEVCRPSQGVCRDVD